MKDIIDAVKKQNGNCSYTNKDLLFYVIGKVDKIDEKLDNSLNLVYKKIDSNFMWTSGELNKKLDKKSFTSMFFGTIAIIIGAIGWLFKVIYSSVKS